MKQPISIYFWPLPRMTLRDRLAPIRGRHLMAGAVETRPNEMSADEFLRIVEATRPPKRKKDAVTAVEKGKNNMANFEIREETVTRRRGVARLARLVGRDHSHISRVLSGERDPGKALERKLRKLGIKLQKEAV